MAREFAEGGFRDNMGPNSLKHPALLASLADSAVSICSQVPSAASGGRMPGLEQFFLHVARRVRLAPEEFAAQRSALLAAAEALSQHVPPQARQMFYELKVQPQSPEPSD